MGRATVEIIIADGGYVAILDMNEELGQDAVYKAGSDKVIFITVDVSNTESIADAVKKSLSWIKSTGKELGGIIAAAGVANPGMRG